MLVFQKEFQVEYVCPVGEYSKQNPFQIFKDSDGCPKDSSDSIGNKCSHGCESMVAVVHVHDLDQQLFLGGSVGIDDACKSDLLCGSDSFSRTGLQVLHRACTIRNTQNDESSPLNQFVRALWGFIVQRVKSDRRGVVNMVLRAPWGARKQGSSSESVGQKLCGILPRRIATNGNRRQVAAERHCVEGASKVVGVHAGKHGNSHRSHAPTPAAAHPDQTDHGASG